MDPPEAEGVAPSEASQSALCRREVSRCKSDHERQFFIEVSPSSYGSWPTPSHTGVRECSSTTGPPQAESVAPSAKARANPSTSTIAG
jgi:hypothetical protein